MGEPDSFPADASSVGVSGDSGFFQNPQIAQSPKFEAKIYLTALPSPHSAQPLNLLRVLGKVEGVAGVATDKKTTAPLPHGGCPRGRGC